MQSKRPFGPPWWASAGGSSLEGATRNRFMDPVRLLHFPEEEEWFMSPQFKRQLTRALKSALIAYLPIIATALLRRALHRRGDRAGVTEAKG